jgi:hypothetical protein
MRLFVAGPVRWLISGLDLREPLHAVGVNLGNPVLEGCALHFVLDFAITRWMRSIGVVNETCELGARSGHSAASSMRSRTSGW